MSCGANLLERDAQAHFVSVVIHNQQAKGPVVTYYTTVIVITWMALAVLCELVRENNRMSRQARHLCYVEFGLIAAAALAEWCGIALDGASSFPAWPLLLAKWADYVLTPLAGGMIAYQLRLRNRWEKVLIALLVFNTCFQTIAFATGNMIAVDEHNHYTHMDLHVVYVLLYAAVFVVSVIQFALFGRTFRKQNRGSLYMTVVLTIAGVATQELLGGGARVAYLSLTFGAAFLYIRNGEFFQLSQDEDIWEQQTQLMVDALTGLGSRHAYSNALEGLVRTEMPADLVAFCMDVNGLKKANDTLGHTAGDELIRAAATCIKDTFASSPSDCYRTGGDEFVVLAIMDQAQAVEKSEELERRASEWHGDAIQELHLASGYALASDWPDATPEALVTHADEAMYAAKSIYYQQSGQDRRLS